LKQFRSAFGSGTTVTESSKMYIAKPRIYLFRLVVLLATLSPLGFDGLSGPFYYTFRFRIDIRAIVLAPENE
jgi:hypothetical protein